MADAVEAPGQDMGQEAADELVGLERHDALTVGAVATVILDPERHLIFIEGDEAAVRDGDAVGIAREIGEHRFRTGEGRLGVDDPGLLAERCEVVLEGSGIGESSQRPEEA